MKIPNVLVVLIADDETPIADTVAMLVEEAGYTPVQAAHGRAALDLARSQRPALVITDLMMPVMDGAALIAALHADAEAQGAQPPPVILLTAASAERARAAHADAVLSKPFDLDALEGLIHRFLDVYSAQDGSAQEPGGLATRARS